MPSVIFAEPAHRRARSRIVRVLLSILLCMALLFGAYNLIFPSLEYSSTLSGVRPTSLRYWIHGVFASPQSIPGYDGIHQVVEPSVVYAARGWGKDLSGHSWKYWMTFAPYPMSNAKDENISLAVSNNGVKWQIPAGLHNPIVPAPKHGHNSDQSLFIGPHRTLYALDRWTDRRNGHWRINALSSRNGVTWSIPVSIMSGDKGFPGPISPVAVWNGRKYLLYYTLYSLTREGHIGSSTIYRASSHSMFGPWRHTRPVLGYIGSARVLSRTVKLYPNELNITRVKHGYYMFLSTTSDMFDLLLHSKHGIHWTPVSNLLHPGFKFGWDAQWIYRGAIVADPNGFQLWYSAKNRFRQWHIGAARITLRRGYL